MKAFSRVIIAFLILSVLISVIPISLSLTAGGAKVRYDIENELNDVFIIGSISIDGSTPEPYLASRRNDTSTRHIVVVKGSFSDDIPQGEKLMVRLSNVIFSMKVNGEETFSFGSYDRLDKRFASPGNLWQSFVSPGITTDDDIEITIYNIYPFGNGEAFSDALNRMCVGSTGALLREMQYKYRFSIIISLATAVFGASALLVMLVGLRHGRRAPAKALAFACLAIVTGLWMFMNFDYICMFIPYPQFCVTFCMMLQFMLPITFAFFVLLNVKVRQRRITKGLLAANIALFLTAALMQTFGLCDLYAFNPINIVFSTATVIICIAVLFTEVKSSGSSEAKKLLLAMLPCAAGFAAELVIYLCGGTVHGTWAMLGFLAFMAAEFFAVIRYMSDQMKIATQVKELQNELLQNRMKLMLSQIQPHFIYNSLNAISGLCISEPEKADEAIVEFSNYLRGNIDAMQSDKPIRFERELEHIKHYLALEKMRFDERVNVVYDINFTDFEIPSLTVQPIVENAVKHGITKRAKGGTITVRTEKIGNSAVITITDDGVGFDMTSDEYKNKNGHISVGIDNVASRLSYAANAEISVISAPDKGTTATITVPLIKKPDNPEQ